jgi:hypothetical protein
VAAANIEGSVACTPNNNARKYRVSANGRGERGGRGLARGEQVRLVLHVACVLPNATSAGTLRSVYDIAIRYYNGAAAP